MEQIRRYALDFQFGLYDTSGMEVFFHKTDVSSLMWIPKNSNEYAYKVAPNGMFRYGLYVKGFTDGKVLPISTIDVNKFPQPLIHFLEQTPFVVLSGNENDELLILVQLFGFKNADGSKSPLVISYKNGVYRIANYPNMTLADFQLLKGNNHLNGLIVDIKESETSSRQMYLLAEYSYKSIRGIKMDNVLKKIKDMTDTRESYRHQLDPINLNLIPIQDGNLQPISRYDRILSAYHACFSWNFKMGMDWVGQDGLSRVEKFNLDEERIINIFLREKTVYPEFKAVKFALAVQLYLTGQESGAKFDAKSYIDSVPDISEKFHVHLIFPEILDKEVFSNFFGKLESDASTPSNLKKYTSSTWPSLPNPFSSTIRTRANTISDLKSMTAFTLFHHRNIEIAHSSLMQIYRFYKTGKLSEKEVKQILSFIYRVRHRPESPLIRHCRYVHDNINTLEVDDSSLETFEQSLKKLSGASEFVRRQVAQGATGTLEIYGNYKKAYEEKFKAIKRQIKQADYLKFQLITEEDRKAFKNALSLIQKLYKKNEERLGASRPTSDQLKVKKVFDELHDSMTKSKEEKQTLTNLKNLKLSSDYFGDLLQYLDRKLVALKTSKEGLKARLSTMATEGNAQKEASLFRAIFMIFHGRKEKDFDNLKRCYFSNNLECFKKKFPNFSEDRRKLEELHQLTFEYFGTENLIRYMEIVKSLAAKVSEKLAAKEFLEIDISLKALRDELEKISDIHERLKIPGMLAYEYSSKTIRLRHEQYEDAMALTKAADDEASEGPFKSTVIQRMMAAGKTMVLGTIASVLKANGKALSILVPPSSLYQSNALSMQERTLKFFKVRGKTIHFERFPLDDKNIATTLNRLKLILRELKVTIESESYFVADPSELSAFHNNFVEALLLYQANMEKGQIYGQAGLSECIKIMNQIYRLFRDKSSIILDEIDMTMAPNLELNYPTQEKEKINMDAARLTADLLLHTAHELDGLVKILSNEQNNVDWIKNGATIKEAWIKYVMTQLKDEKSLWRSIFLSDIVRGNSKFNLEDELKEIEYVLSEPKDKFTISKWLQDLSESKSAEGRNRFHALLAMRMQINEWLPESMTFAAFERYGPSIKNWKTIKYAIPYASAKTPNEGSVFADRWETLNKTLIMYLLKSFRKNEINQIVLAAIEAVIKNEACASEVAESFKICTGAPLENARMASGKLEVRDDSGKLINLVQIFNNGNSRKCANVLKLNYVLKRIFDNLEFNVEQITSNALNTASLFKSVQGYSGTIDNINVLPLQLVGQAYRQRLQNEKNNGAIAAKLLSQSPETVSVLSLGAGMSVDEFLAAMFAPISHQEDFNAIIDVGAYFKSFRNFEVARAVLNFLPHIDAAVFYDEESNQLHYVKKGDMCDTLLATSDPLAISTITGVPLERRFTFYDQRHITGSDIAQKPGAKALLTIGPKVLLRDILQGTMRLRQFMSTQSVHFILTEAVADSTRTRLDLADGAKITIEDILKLSSVNEDEKQDCENLRLAFSKIDDLIRTEALEIISECIDGGLFSFYVDKIRAIKSIRKLFLRDSREDPMRWIGKTKELDTTEVLKMYIQKRMDLFALAFGESTRRDNLIKRLQEIASTGKHRKPIDKSGAKDERLQFYLPDKIKVRSKGDRIDNFETSDVADVSGVEMCMEVEVEVMQELKVEEIQHIANIHMNPRVINLSLEQLEPSKIRNTNEVISLRTPEPFDKSLSEYFSGMFVSRDLVYPEEFPHRAHLIDNWSQDATAMVFVYSPTAEPYIVLLSSGAVKSLFYNIDQANGNNISDGVRIWITDMAGRSIRANLPGSDLHQSEHFGRDDVQTLYFKALLLNLNFDLIFSNPRTRQEFAKFIRGEDPKDHLNMAQRMSSFNDRFLFILRRLIGVGKDKVRYAKHQSLELLRGVLLGRVEDYGKLLALFPLKGDEHDSILSSISFSPDSEENIWKYFELPSKRLETNLTADDDDEEDDRDNIELEDPFKKDWKIKSFISFYLKPAYIGVYLLIITSVAALLWLRYRKSASDADSAQSEQTVAEAESSEERPAENVETDTDSANTSGNEAPLIEPSNETSE